MAVTRRDLLAAGASGLVAAGLPVWVRPAWSAESRKGAPLLVVILLRGAADGLHLVPPTKDRHYAKLRGVLALDATLPFTREFGLHPALEPLAGLVERGELAALHAAGSPHPTRSHFDAQDFMETGTPGSHARDGWMARALGPTQPQALFSRVAVTSQLPVTLRGSGALALDDPQRSSLGWLPGRTRRKLEAMYRGDATEPVVAAGHQALQAARQIRDLGLGRGRLERAGRGIDLRLRDRVDTLVALERAGLGVEAAFLESQGWDTHANQGASKGRAPRRMADLASGVARLFERMEKRREVLCVVMTEFGRTVRPNGSGGSDHGHGSVMFVAGPRVRGGVHGDWRGLDRDALWEGRDLPVLTDFRDVLAETLESFLGAPPPDDTFPAHSPARLGLFS